MITPPKTSPTQRWNFDVRHIESYMGLIGIDEAGRGCFAGPVVAACVCLRADFYQEKKFKKHCKEFNDSKQTPSEIREELLIQLQTWEKEERLIFGWSTASAQEIDQYNIFVATQIAMQRALEVMCKKENGNVISLPQYKTDTLPLFKSFDIQNADNNQKRASITSTTINTPLTNTSPTTSTPSITINTLPTITSTPHPHYKILIDGRPIKKFPHPHHGVIKGDAKSLIIAMASIIAKTQRDRLLRELHITYPQYGFADHKGYGTPQHQKALYNHGPCAEHRQTFLKKFNERALQDELLFDENE